VDSPHHVHKGQVVPGDADSGRGSSGIRDAGRLVYTLVPMSEDEAKTFGISPDERRSYVRLDSAKVNITASSAKAPSFKIVGQSIGNATPEYPNGDTVQVVEPWSPPDTWAGLSTETLNAVLTEIDRGLVDDQGKPDGRRYSSELHVQREANRAIATLSIRLRLSPQSRVDPKTVGSRMPRTAPSIYNELGSDSHDSPSPWSRSPTR